MIDVTKARETAKNLREWAKQIRRDAVTVPHGQHRRTAGCLIRHPTTVAMPLVLLCSFLESHPVKSLRGTTVTCRRTKLDELIRGHFNINANPVGVPLKTVLIFLTGLLLFPLRKRLRHAGIHETAKSLVTICSQLGTVKRRHGALKEDDCTSLNWARFPNNSC